MIDFSLYSKTCLKRPLSKRPKIAFQDKLLLNACQKYCKMLQGEHSAILLTFIKLPFVFKTFVLSILSGRLRQVFLIIRSQSLQEMYTILNLCKIYRFHSVYISRGYAPCTRNHAGIFR